MPFLFSTTDIICELSGLGSPVLERVTGRTKHHQIRSMIVATVAVAVMKLKNFEHIIPSTRLTSFNCFEQFALCLFLIGPNISRAISLIFLFRRMSAGTAPRAKSLLSPSRNDKGGFAKRTFAVFFFRVPCPTACYIGTLPRTKSLLEMTSEPLKGAAATITSSLHWGFGIRAAERASVKAADAAETNVGRRSDDERSAAMFALPIFRLRLMKFIGACARACRSPYWSVSMVFDAAIGTNGDVAHEGILLCP